LTLFQEFIDMSLRTTKQSWQEALSNLITDPKELLDLLELNTVYLPQAIAAARAFPLKVTHSYVARMSKGNVHDPLLLQVLPLQLELEEHANYVTNPLSENDFNPVSGMLHKYHGRILITLTSACAIHCRYCFRRHFPYADNQPGRKGWEAIYSYIAKDPSIEEVILSGGDPLVVNDHLLASFLSGLRHIPHVSRIRIHSRLPIVLPERVTSELLAVLKNSGFDLVMVVHANHANEISDDVLSAFKRLREAGIVLLNQSVLLKSINDNSEALCQLSNALFSGGVLPYYLHVLDKVQGAAHFDIPLERAQSLHRAMCERLPGYLVPRLAQEEPGMPAKTILSTALYTA